MIARSPDRPIARMDMHIKPSLEDLLLEVAGGERDTFAALYRAASPQLFALALRILKRRDAAEEVLQEAFVNVWRHAVDFRPERGTAMGWMATPPSAATTSGDPAGPMLP